MTKAIIAAIVAAVISIVFNIGLALHFTREMERYEKEMGDYTKDKLEEIKKLVTDAHFCKRVT